MLLVKAWVEGRGGEGAGSVSKVFAMKEREPEFGSQHLYKKEVEVWLMESNPGRQRDPWG